MSTSYKISFPLVGVVCILLGLCGLFLLFSGSSEASNTPKNHSLKVCSDAGFLPFEMKNSLGQWEGFDVDMMKDFATSMNAKLEMVQMNFDGIIPALLSKKCDMIAAGMTVTPDRQKVVAFSVPTFENSLSVAFKNSDENNLKYVNLESLDKTGLKIAVKTGYTSDIYLTQYLKHGLVLRFDNDTDLFTAVMQGRANAFVSDTTYAKLIAKENPGKLSLLMTKVTAEKFSVAIRPQDKELLQSFNKFLEKWKLSASYTTAYDKYFRT